MTTKGSFGKDSVPAGVARHYDQEASRYQHAVGRGILGRLREREVESVRRLAEGLPAGTALDVGAGSGFYSALFRSLGHEVTCLDVSAGMAGACRARGFRSHHGTLDALPEGEQWDTVLLMGSLEFNPAWRPMLAAAAERVRPGGRMFVLFPRRGFLGRLYRLYHRKHGFRIQLFTEEEMRATLAGHGVRVDEVERPSSLTLVFRCAKPAVGDGTLAP